MMEREIIVAKEAGFCAGVKRAVQLANDSLEKEPGKKLCSLGPLIHNPSVIDALAKKGMSVLSSSLDENAVKELPENVKLLVRAHGVSKEQYELLRSHDLDILDGTCPHVIAIRRIIERAAKEGEPVVILGDKGHAEVTGLMSFAKEGTVVSNVHEAADLKFDKPFTVVCQSTLDSSTFEAVKSEILKKFPDAKINNTRCLATEKRQKEALLLCSACDAMVVIGGIGSANSNRLAEICKSSGKATFFVTDPANWEPAELKPYRKIGVTAGASTPQSDIDLIISKLKDLI
ncbi:4-hydroxy-3-methylbut-2-enyl diphosphate reductase [bacterium]|nr:4-hydroxy-3-methylbut-2-enyl diphosphate reductase [bacterium]